MGDHGNTKPFSLIDMSILCQPIQGLDASRTPCTVNKCQKDTVFFKNILKGNRIRRIIRQ
jgi:hypothetical protein